MTAGPGEQAGGAMGHGYMRASDADRERVVDALKAAFVRGLLSKEELGLRTGQALGARTFGDLAAITAGIPVGPAGARPAPRPDRAPAAPARRPVPVKKLVACAVIPPALVAAFATYYGGFIVLFLLTFIGTVLTAGPVRAEPWRRWR
jgi:hypothetical protein